MLDMDSEKKVAKKSEKEKNQHIQVVVRARPMNSSEKRQGDVNLVNVIADRKEIVVKEKLNSTVTKTFTFDKVFGPNSKQIEVYNEVVVPILDEVLMGYNCTIFAYGQTGTGKTFTMEGERSSDVNVSWENDPLAGIIPRTLNQLFDTLSGQQADFTVRVSFVELYNEELFDLLTGPEDAQRLRLYEDPVRKGSVVIHGLEEIIVRSKEEVYDILERGARKRQTAATLINAQSSRSHSVFSITVHIRENTLDGEELLKTGKLYLVDLAGSENIGRSGAVDKRAREAGNINQSLLTLGRVITSLVEHAPHVPYRESKLTRLLQDSLGGRTKTSIIATVSPSSAGIEETISTLDYAFRAKNITNRPEVNQKLTKKALMKEYAEEIERLRRDLQAAREKNGIYVAEENYIAMEKKLSQQSENIVELEEKIACVQSQFDKLNDMFLDTQKNLERTRRNLSKTTTKYVEIKEKLCETKQTLKDVSRERDERAFLVDQHLEREDVLHSQAQQLLDVSRRTTANLNVLHTKLDRKKTVEEKNLSTLHTFRNFVDRKIENMELEIGKLTEEHRNHVNVYRQTIDAHVSTSRQMVDCVESTLQKMRTDFDLKVKEFEIKLNADCKEKIQTTQSFDEEVEKCVKFMSAKTKEFHEEFLCQSLQSIESIVKQSTDVLKCLENSINEQHEQVLSSVQCYCGVQKQLMSSFVTVLNEHTNSQMSRSDGVQKILSETSDKHRLMNEQLKKAQEILNVVAAHQNEIVSNELESIKTLSDEMRRCEVDVYNTAENLQTTTENGLNGFKNDVEACAENFRCNSLNLIMSVNDSDSNVTKAVRILRDESCSVVQTIEDNVASSKLALNLLSMTLNENLIDNVASNVQLIKGVSESVALQENNVSEQFVSFMKTVDAEAEDNKIKLETWIKLTDDWAERQTNLLRELGANTNSLISEKIIRDSCAGDTPVRQQLPFPTDLVRTSPHEVLLQRFRERNPLEEISVLEDSLNLSTAGSFVEGEKENCASKNQLPHDVKSKRILETPN